MRGKDNSVIENDTVYRMINNRLVPIFISSSAFHITINRNEGESWEDYQEAIKESLRQAIANFKEDR